MINGYQDKLFSMKLVKRVLNDTKLSLEAKGLFTYLYILKIKVWKKHNRFSKKQLCKELNISRTTLLSRLKELEKYLDVRKLPKVIDGSKFNNESEG
jgi:hypothetical protein